MTWRSTSRDSSTPSRWAADGVRCWSVLSGSVRRAESCEAVGIRFLPATSPGPPCGPARVPALSAGRRSVLDDGSWRLPRRWSCRLVGVAPRHGSANRLASRRARCRGAGRRTRASRGLRDGPCVNEPRTRTDAWARVVAPRAIFVGRQSASRAALDAPSVSLTCAWARWFVGAGSQVLAGIRCRPHTGSCVACPAAADWVRCAWRSVDIGTAARRSRVVAAPRAYRLRFVRSCWRCCLPDTVVRCSAPAGAYPLACGSVRTELLLAERSLPSPEVVPRAPVRLVPAASNARLRHSPGRETRCGRSSTIIDI